MSEFGFELVFSRVGEEEKEEKEEKKEDAEEEESCFALAAAS